MGAVLFRYGGKKEGGKAWIRKLFCDKHLMTISA